MPNPPSPRLIKEGQSKPSKNEVTSNIKFRVMFVSPYFELEVKCNNQNWQLVHSQEGIPSETVSSITTYPIIRFTSFQSALNYAKETLGLTNYYKGSFLGLFDAPQASLVRQSKNGSNSDSSSALMHANTKIM